MDGVDWSLTWRAGVVQALAVALLSLALGLALASSFFREWGWAAGPAAWMACAAATGLVLRLPLGWVLLGAALAGLPSVAAVPLGVHWLGPVVGVMLFAVWCGVVVSRR